MKLKPAPGGPEMTAALAHSHVREIVDTLFMVIDTKFFKDVALFLNTYNQRSQANFAESLEVLLSSFQVFPDENGLFTTPEYAEELLQMITALYEQDGRIVGFQRGAILELLTSRLVSSRYPAGECMSNQRFVDKHGRDITGQIDVAVLSNSRNCAEGYECKIKASGTPGLASEDCSNLRALVRAAHDEEYFVLVGVVSFDSNKIVERRLKHYDAPSYIKAYGLDSVMNLRNTPPFIEPGDDI